MEKGGSMTADEEGDFDGGEPELNGTGKQWGNGARDDGIECRAIAMNVDEGWNGRRMGGSRLKKGQSHHQICCRWQRNDTQLFAPLLMLAIAHCHGTSQQISR